MIFAANKLINFRCKKCFIKGGHLNSKKVEDVFLNKSDIKIFKIRKYKTKNTHGTGCTLSTAITTFFSCGKILRNLVSLELNM